jgi:CRISPR-associated protein Csb1
MPLDVLEALRKGLSADSAGNRPAGIEIRLDLEAAGDLPVQPPSYEGALEIHPRHIDGDRRDVIELDSVGSSANRLEDVLLDLRNAGDYPLPVSTTTVEPKTGPPVTISTLEMPHRVFDAWLRLSDAQDGKGKFEDSDLGRDLSLAHEAALDPLLETSAHDLLFGVWDSHRKGPHGQVRLGRSLTTSLIGLDPIPQAQFAARRDPLNLGQASDLPKGAKKLSEQGLSSIQPQKRIPDPEPGERFESLNGGVSITDARFLGFLSFAALRRLGFERYDATETRVLLATLGLYALALRAGDGWDLRARCALIPKGDLQLALVGPKGEREALTLSTEEAKRLFSDAVARVGITDRSVDLHAGETLNGLVDKAVAAGGE